MKKRILSLALTLTLCLGLTVPVSAHEMSKPGQATMISIAADSNTIGFIDENSSLWMAGSGNLGNGTNDGSATFIKIMDGVSSVSCGGRYTAAVKADGSLWMWGINYYGEMMENEQGGLVLTPKKVMDNVVSVSCGNGFTAAIKTDGSLWTWGMNGSGQLGNGTTEASSVPFRVMENVSAVCCGGDNIAALKTDGSLWTWGGPSFWYPDNNYRTLPVKMMDDVTAFSCGANNIAAIKADGSLWIWGQNSYGQLARFPFGMGQYSIVPRKVMDNVISVTCCFSHVAAITTDNSLWMWGDNNVGELGNGYTASHHEDGDLIQLTPVKVMDDVASVVGNILNSFVVKSDGSIWGCGRTEGVLTSSNATDPYGFPMQTVPARVSLPSGVKVKLSSKTAIAAKVGGFNDVKTGDYFADPVLWAVEKNITAGTSKTTFSPNENCSVSQILTFLWRANGSPKPTRSNPFSDVKSGDYYADAAAWAYEKGMVSGSTFGGNAPCTRSMAVTYMWKAAGSPAASYDGKFGDVPANADYAQAVAWAVEQGVTAGTSATTFSPDSVCNRAQIVAFLYRGLAK